MSVVSAISLVAGALVGAVAVYLWHRRRRRELVRELEERNEELDELRREHTSRIERLRRERDRARRTGHLDFVESLLPGLDGLRRATDDGDASSEQRESSAEGLHEGVQMVRRNIEKTLSLHDVERIEPGPADPFDPECHEALRAADDADVPAGNVVTCHRPGYRFEDRTLRPAAVTVAVSEDADDPDDAGGIDEPDADVASRSETPENSAAASSDEEGSEARAPNPSAASD